MKKYLPSGVVMDITLNGTGGYDVQVVCPPKTYTDLNEGLQDEYNTIYGALIALKSEGIFSGGYSTPRVNLPPVPGIEGGGKPGQKKQAVRKRRAEHKNPQKQYPITDKIIIKIIAIALAEASAYDLMQAEKIFWIYYNLYEKCGEYGFRSSSEYMKKGKPNNMYSLFLTMLGVNDYANNIYNAKNTYSQYAEGAYAQQKLKVSVEAIKEYIETEMKKANKNNPYPTYLHQGSEKDINKESSGAKKHPQIWDEARAYYKLQLDGKVSETYVVRLGEGDQSTFLFDLDAIEKYLKKHQNINVAKTPIFNKKTNDFSPKEDK